MQRLAKALIGAALLSATAVAAFADDPVALQANPDQALGRANSPLILDPRLNDTAADGASLTIQSVGSSTHGTAVLQADGTVSYTPQNGYVGQDGFDYTVSDGQAQATAHVIINLVNVNASPNAADDLIQSSTADPDLLEVPVLSNDVDPDADPMTITDVSPASNGATATVYGQNIQVYNLHEGPTTFTYTVSDARGGISTANVIVNRNAPEQ